MASPRDATEPWRRVLRGGIVLSLTFVLPFLGTFLVLPATLFAGFGALLRRGPKVVPSSALDSAPPSQPAPTL